MPAVDISAEILVDFDSTRGRSTAVGGNCHEFHRTADRDIPDQIRHKNVTAFQDTDKHRIFAVKVLRYLQPDFLYLPLDFFFRNEYALDIAVNSVHRSPSE